MNGKQTLHEKLEAAKEKAALREFEVTITETLTKKVTVMAKDQLDAELTVEDEWNNQGHVLDAGHFTGAEFSAAPVAPERLRGMER